MEIRTVGVVGCGLMGSGIAEVCARAGYDTFVHEVDDAALARGMERIQQSHGDRRLRAAGSSEEDRDAAVSRLRGVTDMSDFWPCDLVIEAVTENPEVKKQVFLFARLPAARRRRSWRATRPRSRSSTWPA